MNKEKELFEEINTLRFRQTLVLSALRNLLFQNNPNGVNDYLIKLIDKNL